MFMRRLYYSLQVRFVSNMKVIKDIFRVWVDESGDIVALMYENGHDTMYTLKRASKADKDELFETVEKKD